MSYQPTAGEKKLYPLKEKADIDILGLCKQLEKRKLTADDRKLVMLIKVQLLEDWRKPLLKDLRELARKYQ